MRSPRVWSSVLLSRLGSASGEPASPSQHARGDATRSGTPCCDVSGRPSAPARRVSQLGVALHPRYGGHMGLRGVLLLRGASGGDTFNPEPAQPAMTLADAEAVDAKARACALELPRSRRSQRKGSHTCRYSPSRATGAPTCGATCPACVLSIATTTNRCARTASRQPPNHRRPV